MSLRHLSRHLIPQSIPMNNHLDDWRPQWYRLWWANMVVKRVHRFLLCFIQSLRPSPPEIRVHVDSLLERVHSLLRDHEDAEHLLRRYERYWPAAIP